MEIRSLAPPPLERPCGGKRIEYIDAMRGFTMLLVVYSHVSSFCFGNVVGKGNPFIFDELFRQFRMPLFFFVSGFVLYSAKRTWSMPEIGQFFRKKIPVQLLFPAVCLVLCMLVTRKSGINESLWGCSKGGYWFTFVLLEYYVVYIVLQLMLRPLRNNWISDVIQVVIAFCLFVGSRLLLHYYYQQSVHDTLLSLFSVIKFQTFIYFVAGTLVRKYFAKFEKILDNNIFVLLCLAVYLSFNILHPRDTVLILGTGISGVLIVFMFFRRYQHSFTADRCLGAVMQYVGRRTLDIYLLHYFFIFTSDLTGLRSIFNGSPVIELCCSMVFSVIVIALCLLVSNVLRISPFISRYCFGVKAKQTNEKTA